MVNINQLFLIKPPLVVVQKIIKNLGIMSLRDKHEFTIDILTKYKTLTKMTADIPMMKDYYLPCKYKLFLENITIKKCITIARQFLKLYGYDILSTEKSINNKKVLFYKLASKDEKSDPNKTKKNTQPREYIIVFD